MSTSMASRSRGAVEPGALPRSLPRHPLSLLSLHGGDRETVPDVTSICPFQQKISGFGGILSPMLRDNNVWIEQDLSRDFHSRLPLETVIRPHGGYRLLPLLTPPTSRWPGSQPRITHVTSRTWEKKVVLGSRVIHSTAGNQAIAQRPPTPIAHQPHISSYPV